MWVVWVFFLYDEQGTGNCDVSHLHYGVMEQCAVCIVNKGLGIVSHLHYGVMEQCAVCTVNKGLGIVSHLHYGVMEQCTVCTFLLGCADVGAVLCECHCVFSMILMQLHLPFSPFNRNLQNMVLWLMEKFYDFIRNFNCSDCNLFSLF